jgi:hypothetical protein
MERVLQTKRVADLVKQDVELIVRVLREFVALERI